MILFVVVRLLVVGCCLLFCSLPVCVVRCVLFVVGCLLLVCFVVGCLLGVGCCVLFIVC